MMLSKNKNQKSLLGRSLETITLLMLNVILLLLVFTGGFNLTGRQSKIRDVLASTFDDNLVPVGSNLNIGAGGQSWRNLYLSDYLKIGALSSPPIPTGPGALYFDTNSSTFKGWDGANWNALSDTFWQANGNNIYNTNSGNVGIGTMNPDEELTVSGGAIRTDRSYKDAFAWQTNSKYASNLSLAYNMGGFGGGIVSPGTNFATTTGWSAYDAGNTGGLATKGFIGAVFDGRYVYFVPYYNNVTGYSGIVLRYDTTQSLVASSSWSAYDAGPIGGPTGPFTVGFSGAVFDGRYIYFVPYFNAAGYDGVVLRYDTTQSFTSSNSWSAYDAGNTNGLTTKGFAGAVFDGRYIYFVPTNKWSTSDGIVLRYDTTQSFSSSGSWSAYNASNTGGLTSQGYTGAVFDGRYVYFVPFRNLSGLHGVVLRYDATQSFSAVSSWSAYDAGNTDGLATKGFQGAVFDGRYVYFVPFDNSGNYDGVVLRYDTTQSFTSSNSWSAYDAGNTNGLTTKGFAGAVFDGRYIYFVPSSNVSGDHGVVLRYDATQSFSTAPSWSAYDAGNTGGLTTKGYFGAGFDGRYIYFSPLNDGLSYSGKVLRFDTGAPYPQQSLIQQARSSDFFIDSNSNTGIRTNTPLTYKLQVGGGDIGTDTAGNGLVLKSPNGSVCERIGIDNSGNVTSTAVTCP